MIPPLRLCFVFLLALLAACSPKYNWREMPAADGAIRVTFPARPQSDRRDVDIAGHTLPLAFDIAPIDTSIFAVGHVVLPEAIMADPQELAKVADAFEEVLRANLRGTLSHRKDVTLKQASADPRKLARAVELEVHGTVANTPSWLLGRVYLLGNHLIEVVALGREDELPRDAAETFVQSARAD
ncbi:MAG: hypothetical protein QHC78_11530 [Pigmentiphaga sp.]|uniref:hypothetical protein n=1 Tax=Pigmentiphaga sp. TaxID=1977564 RepID=UPI0029A16FCE|nr:hypothetical protein [Pigmentiphaga sp.]MDX3906310.1 hypothetical protein [Pigmentiphaga sp.]